MFLPAFLFHSLLPWQQVALAYTEMCLSAGEVILRRSARLGSGRMSATEALEMLFEKPVILSRAFEKAAIASPFRPTAPAVALATIAPIHRRTRRNVKRLRKSSRH